MREIIFLVIVALQIYLVCWAKWGRIYGWQIGVPLVVHVPYQLCLTALLILILNPFEMLEFYQEAGKWMWRFNFR